MLDFTLNALTAKPVLDYLLAEAGLEGEFRAEEAWPIFVAFANLPSQSSSAVSFQAGTGEVPGLAVTVVCARQFVDDRGGEDPETRGIVLEFDYPWPPPEARFQPIELWSTDYPSLAAFFHAVDQQPAFRYAMEATATSVGCYVQYDTGRE